MNINKKTKTFIKNNLPPFIIFWLMGAYNFFNKLSLYPKFIHDYLKIKRLSRRSDRGFKLSIKDLYPCLSEDTLGTSFDNHYILHPAWAARVLSKIKPDFHIDISSSLSFVTILSAFIPVKFYDYRPAEIKLSNLFCDKANLLALPFEDSSVKSISCMHVIEHIGLGRYGDEIDFDGDLKAIGELKRVLAKEGSLLFVVPMGATKIQYNAHRIYSYDQIVNYFSDFTLKDFSLIRDGINGGDLVEGATKEMADAQKYGCGCFWFVK